MEEKPMDYNKAALEMHESHKGKVGIVSKVEVATRDDLSTAYTPGVAEPCRKIKANPEDVYKYTFKGNMVAVVSNGTAVLGLGDIGPEAGLPVMEGKAVLFKEFGGVDAFPICINAHSAEEVIAACKAIAPTFGGINLEDIKSPECFEIEQTLEKELDIPVFHDDQHGTAVVVLASLINAAKCIGKPLSAIRTVISGAGAAGISICRLLLKAGVEDIVLCDRSGAIYAGREGLNSAKEAIAAVTNRSMCKGTLADAMVGCDLFIGVSGPGIVTPDMVRSMADKPIIFALSNPTPEIMPDAAKDAGAYIVATGRSDFPNQINNLLVFPGIFKGALEARARRITEDMMISAAHAIAGRVSPAELAPDHIIPSIFDKAIAAVVADAVKAHVKE